MRPKQVSPLQQEIKVARCNSNGWVYRIAGRFKENERVPPDAIVGAWEVDSNGNITGTFQKNANYNSRRWPSIL